MIPKIIHFIWMQGYDELPSERRRFIDKWVRMHPQWSVRLWSADALPELQNDWVLDVDDPTLQSDVARFEIVYQNGGVYLDTDMECLQPLDNLTMFVGDYDAFISKRSRDMMASSSFGAAVGHPWLADLIDEISRMKETLLAGPSQIRGPIERATRRHPDVTRFHYSFLESRCCEPNAIATHYKQGAWREGFNAAIKSKRPRSKMRKPWPRHQDT